MLDNNNYILLYKNKKYLDLIYNLKDKWFSKKYSQKKKIFYANLLACTYINLKDVESAVNVYKKALKEIRDFSGPKINYNIGIIPEDLRISDSLVERYIKLKLKKQYKLNKLQDLANSIKINPKVRGKYHSNFGLNLLNIIKILKITQKKKSEKIFYLNPKYNSYRVERYLKNNELNKFKKEINKIFKHNPGRNMRLFNILSFAINKHRLKTLNYFCKNPFDYFKEYDLFEDKRINKSLISKINKIINKQSKFDSYQPGSVYSGYKSVGNFFEINQKEIKLLKKIFLKKIKHYLTYYKNKNKNENYIKKFPIKNIVKGWYIKIKSGGGIDYHIHNSWLSAVFYTKLPSNINGGNLDFSLFNLGFKKEQILSHQVKPRVGKLVIFPSSLPHKVSLFKNKEFRISIAFDIIPLS